MEDPRLSRMYAGLWGRWLTSSWDRFAHWVVLNSGKLAAVGVALLVLGAAFAIREHGRGHLTRLKTELNVGVRPSLPPDPRPGDQDPIVLRRSAGATGALPEFLSATLLPGRGMNVFQITASLPGLGEVMLLDSPPLDEAAGRLTGEGADRFGEQSLAMGGALELPWAGRLPGTRPADGSRIVAEWHGRMLSAPIASGTPGNAATGGLLLREPAVSASTNVMPDGGEAVAQFHPGNFADHWVSSTEVTVMALLSSRVLELRVEARNTGEEAEPIGIGWMPRLLVPSGHREQAHVRMPVSLRVKGGRTASLSREDGEDQTYTSREGAVLGTRGVDELFTHLRPALLDVGPAAELRDPESGYGIRITAMTPMIRAFHLHAPAGERFVVLSPQFNLDDPLGRTRMGEDSGMVLLQPGHSVQWKVRVELFSLSATPPEAF